MNNPKQMAIGSVANPRHIRNATIALFIIFLTLIPTIALFGYFGFTNDQVQLQIITVILSAILIVGGLLFPLIRRGRSNLAMLILIINFLIVVISTTLLVEGLGGIVAGSTLLMIIAITSLTLPPRFSVSGIILAAIAGVGLFLLDVLIPYPRLETPELQVFTPYLAGVLGLSLIGLGASEFKRLTIRAKVTLGILFTGGITVAIVVAFSFSRASSLVSYLLESYSAANNERVEQQVLNSVENHSVETNLFFTSLEKDMQLLVNYRADLEARKDITATGTYWDATTQIFLLPGGQSGNTSSGLASVFVPSFVTIDAEVIADLNTSAYMDFYAPNFLKAHPEVVGMYYISKLGTISYYPNINMAVNLPHDIDPRQQPFYSISDPVAGSTKGAHWVAPYQDPAGQGLIVTLSSPVYSNNIFIGVMGIDIQLQALNDQLARINAGPNGYAILVDNVGRILAMPEQGYAQFGISPEETPVNETPKQTILNKGDLTLQIAAAKIINGFTGVENIKINGEEYYFAFTPVPNPNYRLGIITPKSDFAAEITASENEAQRQIETALQTITIILVSLFFGAVAVSLLLGQIITRPIIRLAQIAEEIASGNLTARAKIETDDETGLLANSFNSMTNRLNQTLAGLEARVEERTAEIEQANKVNLRRAAQFESIAKISKTISSSQNLEALLPLIAETIANQLGFYHVGIFLVDPLKQFAVLEAANSEGGKQMLARNHRLEIGEVGLVGYTTSAGQPRIALDVGQDAVYFNNPDLPDTRSEIALPLITGSEIIGALDVQSNESNAFSNQDVSILSALADQVSIAIQNARSLQQAQDALSQAEAATAQLSGQQWKQYINRQIVDGFMFDGVEVKNIQEADKKRRHTLAIPLTLRGVQIGSLKLSSPNAARAWTDDEVAIVQAAADRAALALENARLLDDAQKRAAKERAIGDISSKLGGLVDIQAIIQTAIEELGATIPDTDVAVQFTSETKR